MAQFKTARIIGSVLLGAPLLLAATPLQAKQKINTQGAVASQSDASASSKSSSAAEKKICKRLETTGSRMARRACHTAEEWRKIEEEG